MRAGVQQAFAFQENTRAAAVLRQPLGKSKWRRTPSIVALQGLKLAAKKRIALAAAVRGREFVERRDQRFGDKTPTVFSPETFRVRLRSERIHMATAASARTACNNSWNFSRFL